MRMVGLALLIFLLMGVSIALTQMNVWQFAKNTFAQIDTTLIFEVDDDEQDPRTQHSFSRAHPDGVLLLSGSTQAQSARFVLPKDAPISSGELQVNATAQVSNDTSGMVRIFVGKERRGEVLLRPGQQNFNTTIELTPQDLARDELWVRYAMAGLETTASCTTQGGTPAVVEIEQDSRLILDLETPTLTTRDQVASWGDQVLIGWPSWLSDDERQLRQYASLVLAARGYTVRMVDAPNTATLSGDALIDFVTANVHPDLTLGEDYSWPYYVAETGPNAGIRRFHGGTSWRHWYTISPSHHTSEPAAFAYSVLLGPLPDDAGWTVTVTHNGTILEVIETSGDTHVVEGTLSLDGLPFGDSNVIEVTASSDYEIVGMCNVGPELVAELRPETRLIGGGDALGDALENVRATLAQHEVVPVRLLPGASLVETQRLIDLTKALLPQGKSITTANDNALIVAVQRASFARITQELPPEAYIVWFDDDGQGLLSATVAEIARDPDLHPQGALALAVSPLSETQLSALDP